MLLRYLLIDQLATWKENPGSLLARGAVAFLLTSLAGGVLLSFFALREQAQARLERFGDREVRAVLSGTGVELLALPGEALRRGARETGEVVRLRRLRASVLPAWEGGVRPVPVWAYAPADAVDLGLPVSAPQAPEGAWLVRRAVAANQRAVIQVPLVQGALAQGLREMVVPEAPIPAGLDWLLGEGPALLVPLDGPQDAEAFRGQEVIDMRAATPSASLRWADWLRGLGPLCGGGLQVQDSGPIQRELADLDHQRRRWRALLMAGLVPVLGLVLAALAVLEFRQAQTTLALLRALGCPGSVLWMRALLEQALVVGTAGGLAAWLLLRQAPRLILLMNGALPPRLDLADFVGSDLLVVAVALAAGVALGSLPVAIGLLRPVGRVLQ